MNNFSQNKETKKKRILLGNFNQVGSVSHENPNLLRKIMGRTRSNVSTLNKNFAYPFSKS